jgi:hypothetical protein
MSRARAGIAAILAGALVALPVWSGARGQHRAYATAAIAAALVWVGVTALEDVVAQLRRALRDARRGTAPVSTTLERVVATLEQIERNLEWLARAANALARAETRRPRRVTQRDAYPSFDQFLAGDARRRAPAWDFGIWDEGGRPWRISWSPATHEVFATPRDGDGHVALLGTIIDPDFLAALLYYPKELSLAWATRRIEAAPTDPEGVAAVIERADQVRRAAIDARDQQRRRGFVVLLVEALPDTDAALGLAPGPAPCSCRECSAGDWRAISRAAVQLLAQMDPLGIEEIRSAVAGLALSREEREFVVGLFRKPIELWPGGYNNGRHRAHALRRAGAEKCVVWLGRRPVLDEAGGPGSDRGA